MIKKIYQTRHKENFLNLIKNICINLHISSLFLAKDQTFPLKIKNNMFALINFSLLDDNSLPLKLTDSYSTQYVVLANATRTERGKPYLLERKIYSFAGDMII